MTTDDGHRSPTFADVPDNSDVPDDSDSAAPPPSGPETAQTSSVHETSAETGAPPPPQAHPHSHAQSPPPTHRRAGRTRRRRSRPAKKKSFLRELPGIVLTALVISVLIKTFLVQAFYIPSGSMENTLLVNDRVLVNKLADKPDEIHRGDVVVFRDPGGWLGSGETTTRGGLVGLVRKALVFVGLAPAAGEEDLIKRVIGVGGDTVQCKNHQMVVNGAVLDEPYLYPSDRGNACNDAFTVHVPKDRLWVMGDHRSVSEDSRAHVDQAGSTPYVPVSDVIGRAFTIVWPLDRATLLHRPATFDQPKLQSGG